MNNKEICCPICQKIIIKDSYVYHGKTAHNLNRDDSTFYILKVEKQFKCDLCDKAFCTKKALTKHKNELHGILSKDQEKTTNAESKRIIECKICGKKVGRLNHLSRHIKNDHTDITVEDYYMKYTLNTNIRPSCKQCGNKVNFDFTVGFNDFCCFSCSTTWYAKNTNRIKTAMNTIKENKKNDPDFQLGPMHIKYWINKGYSEEDAKKMVTERQTTFNLEKCIKKYGEVAGKLRWKDRQNKWIKNYKKRNYSIISQKLFWKLFDNIDKNIILKFAQNNNGIKDESGKNHEYVIETNESYCKLDFYIPEINYCIEFDGDYWHGEKPGNKERDNIRENQIKIKNPNITIVHVKEKDFKNDPDLIIQTLINDIIKRIDEKNRSTI